ncbi:hypothetical protein L6V77_03850 [Myxococcota bacterium]|nr:hypothetical protein [Myxococcota bacterium]
MVTRRGWFFASLVGVSSATPAAAFTDAHPQTDTSAETLDAAEFRLGLGRFEAGITDTVMLGTKPLAWVIKVKNLGGKWRFYDNGAHAVSAGVDLYWFNARDFDEDNADVTFYCFPLRATYTYRQSSALRWHVGLSYTAIGTRGGNGGDNDVDFEGVGVVETAVLNPVFEWAVSQKWALLVDASTALFQRASANADQKTQIDAYTTLTLHQDADADLKTGFLGWIAGGFLYSREVFNLRFLLGYGNYPVPVVNFFVPEPIPMFDFDLWWRF